MLIFVVVVVIDQQCWLFLLRIPWTQPLNLNKVITFWTHSTNIWKMKQSNKNKRQTIPSSLLHYHTSFAFPYDYSLSYGVHTCYKSDTVRDEEVLVPMLSWVLVSHISLCFLESKLWPIQGCRFPRKRRLMKATVMLPHPLPPSRASFSILLCWKFGEFFNKSYQNQSNLH